MRAYGSGHFEKRKRKLKSGRFREFAFGYVLSEFPNEKGVRRHYASGKTIAIAEAKAKAKAKAHDDHCRTSEGLADRIPTLCEFFDEWISQKKLATSSTKKYRTWRKHLCGFTPADCSTSLGSMPVNKISFVMVERCYLSFTKSHAGKSPANFRDILSELWERMTNRDYVRKNLAKNLPAAQRNFKRRRLPFKRSDVGVLYSTLDDPRLEAFTVLGSHGLRAGEILGATFENIYGNMVRISCQFCPCDNPEGNHPETIHGLCSLKHQGRCRDVKLSDEEMKILLRSVELAKPTKVYDAIQRAWVTVTFLIPNAKGGGWCYHDFRLKWTAARRKATSLIKPHDLRRAFASQARSGDLGLNPLAVSEALGHSDLETTTLYQFCEDEEVEAVHDAASAWVRSMVGNKSG